MFIAAHVLFRWSKINIFSKLDSLSESYNWLERTLILGVANDYSHLKE